MSRVLQLQGHTPSVRLAKAPVPPLLQTQADGFAAEQDDGVSTLQSAQKVRLPSGCPPNCEKDEWLRMVRKGFGRVQEIDGELLRSAGAAPLLACPMRYQANEASCRVTELRSS